MPEKNTTRVVCVAEFFAKEGKTEELIDALHVLKIGRASCRERV